MSSPSPKSSIGWRPALTGAATGLAYGLSARAVFAFHQWQNFYGLMTIGFLFVVPFALGFAAAWMVGDGRGYRTWGLRIVAASIASLSSLAAALALAWEGAVCIVLWAPAFLLLAILGAGLAGLIKLYDPSRSSGQMLFAGLLLMPFLVTPLENRLPTPTSVRTVETSTPIQADARTIWDQIKSVPPIRPEELRESFTHRIGFPRPIAATLSHEGVGGIRNATFEGNVLFIETVNVWEPERRLRFSIRAATDQIPSTTLDQHVTVGGPYFDVLDGEYEIEMKGPRSAVLHLSSRHRLSTRFNFYSSLWTDFIMRDIQENILDVIRKRCEGRKS